MLRGMPPLQLETTAQCTERLLEWLASVANRSTSRRHRSRWAHPHQCSGPVGHGTGREGRLGGRWAAGRGADACFCPTGGHLVLVVLCSVQRANGGVLVAMQPDRSVPLAPSPAPVTHLAGGRARARGSPPWHAAYTHACASPMSGGDGLPPSSSGIAGGLRRPVNNTRGKPLILTVACATWGKPR